MYPKTKNKQDEDQLAWMRKQPCAKCSRGPCEASHQRILGGGGMSLKPSSSDCLPLCYWCHHIIEHGINGGAITLWGQGTKEKTREYVRKLCDEHIERYEAWKSTQGGDT